MCYMDQAVKPYNLDIGPITCHAWNKDRTQLALSPNSSEVHIYAWRNNSWVRTHILTEHDLPVTGIDWAPNSDRIVTCAQDKNAFVWTFDGKAWKPVMVLTRFNKAATCVKWSPQENKFAVGSADKLISICYYEKENDWWLSKHIRKSIRSTVTSIDWHPNNILLAVGACDFKARVFSAFIKEVDEKPQLTPWGPKMETGVLMTEYSSGGGGWVHAVRFSPNGTRLAWVSHNASLLVAEAGAPQENGPSTNSPSVSGSSKSPRVGSVSAIRDQYLPFTTLEWVTENNIVVAGHNCCPLLYNYAGPNKLTFVSKLDVPSQQKASGFSAMNKFKSLASTNTETVDRAVKTLHQNMITQLAIHTGSRQNVTRFSTCSTDGMLVLWNLQTLSKNVSEIKLT